MHVYFQADTYIEVVSLHRDFSRTSFKYDSKEVITDPELTLLPTLPCFTAEWTQIALILFHVEPEKRLRETEDYLNEMPVFLLCSILTRPPIIVRSPYGNNSTECVNSAACSAEARGRRVGVVKSRLTRVASNMIKPAIITATGQVSRISR